jgi:phage baseplate assembly protein W
MAKFMGLPYPIKKHAQGFFHTQDGVNQIKSDLLVLLLTNPGERIFLPTYGTPLRRLVFEPNDAGLEFKARQMIINSIKQWEPRIAIKQIEVKSKVDDDSVDVNDDKSALEHILSIKIIFVDPENIQEVQELKLEMPLAGG